VVEEEKRSEVGGQEEKRAEWQEEGTAGRDR